MRTFLWFCFIYHLVAVSLSAFMRGGEWLHVASSYMGFFRVIEYNVVPVSLVTLAAIILSRLTKDIRRFRLFLGSVLAFFLVKSGFTMFKAAMPGVSGFWADHGLAEIDRVLHFGIDPWELAHSIAPWLDAGIASAIYLHFWVALAFLFTMLITVFDQDEVRRNRYLWLNAFAWIGLGNVVAVATLSSGPIYYDALHGGERFMGLHAALNTVGLQETATGFIQWKLLDHHLAGLSALGTGISAFPSVHVGVAAVIACYLWDARPIPGARVVGIAFLVIIQFLSVWLGWHYAVDGYFSIMAVLMARAVLLRMPFRRDRYVDSMPQST